MGRKRKQHGATVQAEIQAAVQRGLPASEVARRTGLSERTSRRRMAEVRSFSVDLAAAGGIPADIPCETPSEPRLPTESDLEEAAKGGPELLDQTLASFVLEYRAAPPGSPVKQRWGALILKGNDDRRKMTPPARPDPNEAPDLVAAARRARETLHNLIETSPEAP